MRPLRPFDCGLRPSTAHCGAPLRMPALRSGCFVSFCPQVKTHPCTHASLRQGRFYVTMESEFKRTCWDSAEAITMSHVGARTSNRVAPVEQVARLIQGFNRREKARLVQLVPELRTIRPEEANLPAVQEELMTYFDSRMARHPELRPMQDGDSFLGGLTVAAFFALPEAEQDHVWSRAHNEAERAVGDYEQPVREDALSAR